MLNAQIKRLHELALSMATSTPMGLIGTEQASIYNAILEELKTKFPNDKVLAAVPQARNGMRWAAFAAGTSQLQAVADKVDFA